MRMFGLPPRTFSDCMKIRRGITLAAAVPALACASITYDVDIPAFREGVDAYRVLLDASGEWTDGKFVVSVPERKYFEMVYDRVPGMKPFRGTGEIVIDADFGGLGEAQAKLALREFPGAKMEWFFAPLTRETRFKTNLDPSKLYQLRYVGVSRAKTDGGPWKIGFASMRGVYMTAKAGALCVEAETGNPLHIVREGQNEKPMLAIRNAALERIAAHGVLKATGFHGDTFDLPVDVALDGGHTAVVPIMDAEKKGVWRIGGELTADDGSTVKVDTRFAVMDYHARTPKQPKGTFRLGVNWHIGRFTPEDRRLTAAAMVACGAKLARGDMAHMRSIQPDGPDSWDFTRTDELIDTLETNGFSIDAIIFSIPKWAAKPENQTNADWRAWAMARPVPGTFGKFCERLSARYGTRIDYYEIGNEWDLKGFFYGTCEDAVEIMREGSIGLKRGCPGCCVIPGGWATAEDSPGSSRNMGVQDAILRQCRDYFDVHAIHCHAPFGIYVNFIKNSFFPLRERTGASSKPWYANEAALSSVWNERTVALTVWKKILWTWAQGSVDYVWYNLKATGWDPKDSEQGYGLITADYFPRDSYVAFAALASVVGGAEFDRTVADDSGFFCFEFTKGDSKILAAWGDREVPVKTDAIRAWKVDLMGNRTVQPVTDRRAVFSVPSEPAALVLEGATFAEVDKAALAAGGNGADASAILIPSDSQGRKPDFVLEKPEQVRDFFVGNPEEIKRLWTGPKDNSAKVWLAKDVRGLRIRVEVEDDRNCQPYSGPEQYKGDDVQVALAAQGQRGHWEFGFAHGDDGMPAVHCWIAPDGFDADEAAAWVELATSRVGTITRYDALIPYAEAKGYAKKTLEDGIRFNLMVNDNDGDGRDATIEIVPETFHSKDILLAPVVRFGSRRGQIRAGDRPCDTVLSAD